MKMRTEKDKMFEKAEIILLAARRKELVCKTILFIDEAMNVLQINRMEGYQTIIAESDDLMQEYDHFCKM